MQTTGASYSVIALGEAAPDAASGGFGLTTGPEPDGGRRGRVHVRRELDIGAFGVNAFYQATSGARVIGEHVETSPGASGHEELYVVVEGACTFTVDGAQVDAPRGTALFVRDPAARRSARASEDGTIVLVVGGRRGEAFVQGPGEALAPFFALYRSGDHAGALAACREALALHPGNALILYNIACLEARLGQANEALEALAESLAASPDYRARAAEDDDLASLRQDARFQALVAIP
jgi:hypothetical protein